jgi:Fe-S-cluster containining protein
MSEFLKNPEESNAKKLSLNDTFHFGCNVCGNCCRGRSAKNDATGIFLSGPDVKRMAKELDCSINETIEKYLTVTFDKDLKLYVCKLKIKYSGCCSLLRKGKCLVYHARPRTCAIYPLARGILFYQHKNFVEYANDEYYINDSDFGYACDLSDKAPEYTIESWLNKNNVPIEDIEDRDWHKTLMEFSMNMPKFQSESELMDIFSQLYMNIMIINN